MTAGEQHGSGREDVMPGWTLGPAHRDYGKPLETLPPPGRPRGRPRRDIGVTWRCKRRTCRQTFTITAFLPEQDYCTFACAVADDPERQP